MRPVSARQLDVLRWIAEGTPQRDWPDYTHRTTAKALQSRGLVKVRGRGPSWTAEVTDLGERILNGEQVPAVPPKPPGPAAAPRVTPVEVDPAELLQRVRDAPGRRLVIPAPPRLERAGYLRVIAAITRDLLADAERLTYQGRDKGDLVIALVDRPDPGPAMPHVSLPTEIDTENAAVRHLLDQPDQLEVSDATRDRALRIIQALTEALSARGHTTAAGDSESSLVVIVDGQEIRTVLRETQESVQILPADEVAKVKYEWQRVRPVTQMARSGRLALSVAAVGSHAKWADTTRWRLETRLPRFVHDIEVLGAARAAAARTAAEARAARRRAWEEAVPKARAAYIAAFNRERLRQQLEAHRKVLELRSYADAVADRAASLEELHRSAALAWAERIRAEASREEVPAAELRSVEPESIRPWDLDRFMPRGFSASRPPD